MPDVKDQPAAAAPKAAPAKPKAKAKAAKGRGGKPGKTIKPKAAPKPKAESKYSDEVRAVAKSTRAALPAGARAPGAAQIKSLVDAIGATPVTEASGLSLTALKAWAVDGDRPKDREKFLALTKAIDDPWLTSRRLSQALIGLDAYRKDENGAAS